MFIYIISQSCFKSFTLPIRCSQVVARPMGSAACYILYMLTLPTATACCDPTTGHVQRTQRCRTTV